MCTHEGMGRDGSPSHLPHAYLAQTPEGLCAGILVHPLADGARASVLRTDTQASLGRRLPSMTSQKYK